MREELWNISETDYWLYGLSEGDLDYTMALAKGFVLAKQTEYREYEAKTREETPEVADDILDDVSYYNWVETQYVWHFCLWRLQAVFEGIIVYRLMPEEKRAGLIGLRAKLNAVRQNGYSLTDEQYEELLAWGRIRNALSHAPPEQFQPGLLREEDVFEYKVLVSGLLVKWGIPVQGDIGG